MKVFIVKQIHPNHEWLIDGVYSNEQDAKKYVDKQNELWSDKACWYWIYEGWELE